MSGLALRQAGLADLATIMATERLPGYDKLVGRWERPDHEAAFANPDYRYFLATHDGAPVGFCLLRGWNAKDHVCLIKRAALSRTDAGIGRWMIAETVSHIFTETDAWRCWIGCFPDNFRARKAYEAAGFTAEGIARGNAYFHGEHRDELILSILRPEREEKQAKKV